MKKIFLVLLLCTLFINTFVAQSDNQRDDTEKKGSGGLLGTYPMSDTKAIQSYYQNLFSSKSSQRMSDLFPSYDVDKEKLIEKLREAIPLQGPVDPSKYLVGPGDIFDITIVGNLPNSLIVQVSPEGSLVIPTIGVINIKGMTLSEAKIEVEKVLKQQFKNANINTTLISPRIFSVSVAGIVNNPGNFYASSVQRVDEVIYLANLKTNLAISEISQLQNQERELLNRSGIIQYFRNEELTEKELKMSLRNIQLTRLNGETLIVDLVRFYATGDVKYNPFLQDGDRIFIPNESLEGNSITISGEVRLEGQYEYSEHDSLSSVLSICQGPTNLADLEKVNLYRTNFSTGEITRIVINFQNILNKSDNDIPLQPGDRIVFRKKYPRETALSVTIKGEVLSPGVYPIERNNTTIKDIIKEAGGFTNYASLSEASIIRFGEEIDKANENPDYMRLAEMRLGNMNQRMREYFNYEYAIKRGIVAVDFVDLFVNDNENFNITLQDGDVIIIPEQRNSIYIFGQVARNGYYSYLPDADFNYYINLAGGYGEMAQSGDARIIKAGTKNWLEPGDTSIEPGDAIYIPREMDFEDKTFKYWFTWFSEVVAVVAGIATVILVAQSAK
ncbi:polysaccharide export protein [hydrocarbon metagenome]|uniref:Polysaccharide export protein n=1 Tax=hydrocarbon metagenome TaxID=938273 RepID=A0A0W8FW23_9ZZZZ